MVAIVIIGILASITVVTYNHVQERACNAKVIAGVDAYKKAIINYAARNNTYPTTFGACLGDGYPSDKCWNGTNGTYYTNSGLDATLAPYLDNKKPVLATDYLQVTSTDQRLGAIYMHYSASDVRIIYYLEGRDQKCIDGDTSANEMQTTQCQMNLPPVLIVVIR